MTAPPSQERLQESLTQVKALLERHRVLELMTHRQEGPKRDLLESLQHRQNLAELHAKVKGIHPADLAYILETLTPDERLLVWEQLGDIQRGEVLVEASETVGSQLISATDRPALLALLRTLDADDLAFLAPSLPDAVFQEVYGLLDAGRASWVRSSIAYAEGSVGQLMSQELVAVRETQTLEEAVRDLRGRESLPPHFNALFIVDARNVLRGVLSLKELLLGPPDQPVSAVMATDVVTFTPAEKAVDAAAAFERYDLLSAPVVDERGKLVGRLTVDAVMDFLRRRAEIDALKRAGLQGEEDIFAPVWDSARNRWLWLFVNLVTAFVASRVIGLFESTIGQLVALATLMPIVASIAGNTGNQTVALMIRALTLGQITPSSTSHLVRKELTISLLNGAVWGTIVGLCAATLYGNLPLGGVMAAAILLNLVIGAMVGIVVPLVLHSVGRDPAQGASVLLTFTTDGMGFFIFLGLARVFLL